MAKIPGDEKGSHVATCGKPSSTKVLFPLQLILYQTPGLAS